MDQPNKDTDTGLKDMVQTDSAVSYLHAEVMGLAASEVRRQLCEKGGVGLHRCPG